MTVSAVVFIVPIVFFWINRSVVIFFAKLKLGKVCKQSKVFFCFVLRLHQNQAGTASRFPSQKLILYAICFVKKSRIIICARVGGIIEKKMITIFFFL